MESDRTGLSRFCRERAVAALLAVAGLYVCFRTAVFLTDRVGRVEAGAGYVLAVCALAFVLSWWAWPALKARAGSIPMGKVFALAVFLRLAWAFIAGTRYFIDHLGFYRLAIESYTTGKSVFTGLSPGTSLVYGLLFRLWDHVALVYVVNSLVHAFYCTLIHAVCLRLGLSRPVALLSALLWCFYPTDITFTPVLSSETLAVLATLAMTLISLDPRPERAVAARAAVTGLLFYLGFISRNAMLFFLPSLAILWLRVGSARRYAVFATVFGLAFGGLSLFHVAHNYREHGVLTLKTHMFSGVVEYFGAHRPSEGTCTAEESRRFFAHAREVGLTQASRDYSRMAREAILADPGDFLAFALSRKFDRMWASDSFLEIATAESRLALKPGMAAYEAISVVNNIHYHLLWLCTLAFALLGYRRQANFMVAFLFATMLAHVFLEVQQRYHYPVTPFLCIMAALGVDSLSRAMGRLQGERT